VAVVFAGLPNSYESEGFDRTSIDLPPGHRRLIEAVSAAQPMVVVVLMNGSAVAMPWADQVKGIVEGWLGGQAGGGAIADVLTGKVNPSGKLSETFPVNLEQTPTYPNFPGRDGRADYGEGLFIGYRYYDKKQLEPLFPFGFGLSYTSFAYTGIHATSASYDADAGGEFTVEVKVKNVGRLAGQEVAQLYVGERQPCVLRPDRELRAFAKVALEPGEERVVHFSLDRRAFAYYNPAVHEWEVNPGTFDVLVGGSSRDLPLQMAVNVRATPGAAKALTRHSMIKEFRDHPQGKAFYEEIVQAMGFAGLFDTADLTAEQIADRRQAQAAEGAFLGDIPINKVPAFSAGAFTEARLNEVLQAVASDATAGLRQRK
jgi:beta-glucosidase